MSYRELWVLLNRLPQDSWTQTELRDTEPDSDLVSPDTGEQEFGPWALEHYLLANLIDAVSNVGFINAQANSKDKLPAPKPTPRPGAKKSKVKAIRPPGAVAYLNSLRATGG